MKNGPFVKIEKTIGGLFEKEYALFTRNGTTAIWLALEAMGLKGKQIIVPANICFVVMCAIICSDNLPYFIDIDDNFSIDPKQLENIKAADAAAVILPHMYGNTGSIKEVMEIARQKKWLVIEDVAQALGAKIGRCYAGSFADFSITSFGMGKIVDVNFGGVLCLSSRKAYQKAVEIYAGLPIINEKLLSAYVRFNQIYSLLVECLEQGDEQFRFGWPLVNSYRDANIGRLGDDQEDLGPLEDQLENLDNRLSVRQENAAAYQSVLDQGNVQVIKHNEGATYWRQNILVKKDRDGLLKHLKQNGIKASKYFPSIDRLFCQRNNRKFHRSDRFAFQVINLWPGSETTGADIERTNKCIRQYFGSSTKEQN